MKRWMVTTLCLLLVTMAVAQEKKLLLGFDGGMMVHAGFLFYH